MIARAPRPLKKRTESAGVDVTLLLAAVFLLAVFVIVRYGGMWGEVDTSSYAKFIKAVDTAGTLTPERFAYANGYGFSALGSFLLQISGVSLKDLQVDGAALLVIWVVLPAWLLFRELSGSLRGATLATVIYFVQPEFLFPILRGTHEKFTRSLMMLSLYLLLRSIRSGDRVARLAGLLVAFYLASYAMVTFNNLISTSFIAAIGLALALAGLSARILRKSKSTIDPPLARLGIVLLSLLVVAFMFTFYAYPPAQQQLIDMRTVLERLFAMFLPVEAHEASPYSYVTTGWVSMPVYWLVSLANWLLLGVSAVLWLKQGYDWLFRRLAPRDQRELLMWAFYGAFCLIGALSVVVDLAGSLSKNLQLRVFPSFAMLAAPLVARWLADWRPCPGWKTSLAKTGLAVCMMLLAVLSVLKATNEPLVSNKWAFYLPAEVQGMKFIGNKIPGRQAWTDLDERLNVAYYILEGGSVPNISQYQGGSDVSVANFLISDVTRLRSLRLGVPLPVRTGDLVTYDNGQAQIYHLRPLTPYQR